MRTMTESFMGGSVTASRKQAGARYYEMDQDLRAGLRCFELANRAALQKDGSGLLAKPAWPDGYAQLPRHPWRFPDYLEPPRLLFDKKGVGPARDLEAQDGFWYVSRAMKDLLERVDSEACEFRKCDTVWVSGEPGPEYWLCSVTRFLYGWDVIDFAATKGLTQHTAPNGLPSYRLVFGTDVRFEPQATDAFHLFRVIGLGDHVFCDQFVKDACKAAGMKGIRFGKLYD